jgi:hypothetical protein
VQILTTSPVPSKISRHSFMSKSTATPVPGGMGTSSPVSLLTRFMIPGLCPTMMHDSNSSDTPSKYLSQTTSSAKYPSSKNINDTLCDLSLLCKIFDVFTVLVDGELTSTALCMGYFENSSLTLSISDSPLFVSGLSKSGLLIADSPWRKTKSLGMTKFLEML